MADITTMSRRNFVKLTTAAAATALVAGGDSWLTEAEAAYADEAQPERVKFHTACHGCSQSCAVIGYMEDGVVVKLEGDPADNCSQGSLCSKGQSQLHTVYSPRRILHPMKRVGKKGTENNWEVISWDEALTLAASKIIETKEKYGPYAIWAAAGGGGNYVSPVSCSWPFVWGGTTQFSPGAIQCAMPRHMTAGFMMPCRQSVQASLECLNNYSPAMEVHVAWGTQLSVSQTAMMGHGYGDARVDRGLKTVVIDPVFTPDAAKADVWIPVRPGTDAALALCWIRYIVEHELYDEEFCKYWTNLPFVINPETKLPYLAEEIWPDYVNPAIDPNDVYETPAYVCFDNRTGELQPFPFSAPEDSPVDPELFWTGEVNGVESKTAYQIYYEGTDEWTLEHTAEVCWVNQEDIVAGIELFASTEHGGITLGVFADQMESCAANSQATMAIDVMLGHVYKPGCTAVNQNPNSRSTTRPTGPYNMPTASYQGSNNRYGLGWTVGWTKRKNDEFLAEQMAALDEKYEGKKDVEAMREQVFQMMSDRFGGIEYKGIHWWSQTVNSFPRDAMLTGEPYKVRNMYYVSGNLLSNVGNASKWVEAMQDQDWVTHQYANLTSFDIEFTDLFLPTVEWLEYHKNSSSTWQSFIHNDVIHLGETLQPEQPAQLIVERAGELLGDRNEIFDPDFMLDVMGMYTDSEKQKAKVADRFGAESWDELVENYDDYLPAGDPAKYWQYYQHLDIAEDGLPVGFATESRKCEPYCSWLVKMGRTGWPFVYPYELPPASEDYSPIAVYTEGPENPLTDTEYPLSLTFGRVFHFHHGTMRHAPFNRELYPEPEILINPATAAERGIEDGDWVSVSSRRGTISAKARLFEGIHPSVVKTERFWNPECFDDSQESITGGWAECNPNCLTYDDTHGKVFGNATYRGIQVKVEKGSKPDRVWEDPKDFQPFMPTLMGEPVTEELY